MYTYIVFANNQLAHGYFVKFHGIYMFPAGITLLLVSVMHLWATLGCGVFSCHSNLVNHVRGSISAPSVKSVAHRAVYAEISSSSDVKSYSNQRVIYHKPKSSNCLNTQRE